MLCIVIHATVYGLTFLIREVAYLSVERGAEEGIRQEIAGKITREERYALIAFDE